MRRHILIGAGAVILILAVYLSIMIPAEGLRNALEQASRLWYWMLLLAVGFGVQAGLFSFIRHSMRQRRAAATASVAASGGISAGSMAACCAHHLSDVLPLLGLSGLTAFLASYQFLFIIVGILSNAVGITVMLDTIQRHGLCPRLAAWGWNMHRVKQGTMISAVAILIGVSVVSLVMPSGA